MSRLGWLWRTLDYEEPYHRALFVVTFIAAAVGVTGVLALDYDWWLVVEVVATPVATWAVTRELDPDRELTAIIAALAGAVWVLVGQPVHILFMGGVLFAARIIAGTTGARPTRIELGMVAIGASLISFTELGFIAGFALAVAIYIDNQNSGAPTTEGLVAAVTAAVGSAAMATVADAFPTALPEIELVLVIVGAVVTLLAVSWEPPQPVSQVDASTKEFLSHGRLVSGRVVVAMACLAGTLLGDTRAGAVAPFLAALVLAMASSELERITRSRLT